MANELSKEDRGASFFLSHKAVPVVIPNCANLGENKHNKTISQTD